MWEKEPGLAIAQCREMDCFKKAWDDWLQTGSPYAQNDIAWMNAGGWQYTNLIQITGLKKILQRAVLFGSHS